jgi:hypothetical protein
MNEYARGCGAALPGGAAGLRGGVRQGPPGSGPPGGVRQGPAPPGAARVWRRLRTDRVAAGIAGLAAVGLVACASSRSSAGSAGSSCGTTRTGANVPVVIKVVRGNVDCGTVMRVEDSYATMIKDGKVPGNGGGAPVSVNGWVCEGYPTPEVLRTGDASQCHTTSAEVVAVLALPSPGS